MMAAATPARHDAGRDESAPRLPGKPRSAVAPSPPAAAGTCPARGIAGAGGSVQPVTPSARHAPAPSQYGGSAVPVSASLRTREGTPVKLQFIRFVVLGLALFAAQGWAQNGPSFGQVSAQTRAVADPYFKAYIARDWDRLEPLLADAGSFTDPTAALVFGSVEFEGKAAMLKNFREGYAAIRHMAFHPLRVFVSGEHAIYEGTLDWTLELRNGRQAVTQGMPFVTVLRVVHGRVLEHRDFADYTPFLAAMRAGQAGG